MDTGELHNWLYFKIPKTFNTTGVFQGLLSRRLFIVQGHRPKKKKKKKKRMQTLCMQMFGKVFSTVMYFRFCNLYWDYKTNRVLLKSRNLVKCRDVTKYVWLPVRTWAILHFIKHSCCCWYYSYFVFLVAFYCIIVLIPCNLIFDNNNNWLLDFSAYDSAIGRVIVKK
jgi:hypothetical protein